MTEMTAPDPDTHAEVSEENEAGWLKDLRAKAKRVDDAENRVAALERKVAFSEAGIPDEGPAKWFRKGYEGDLDPEAIRAAAAADGLIDVSAEDAEKAEQVANASEAAGRMSNAAAEGGGPQPSIDALLADAGSIDEIERLMQDAGLGVAPT